MLSICFINNYFRYLLVDRYQELVDEILSNPEERVVHDMGEAMQKLVDDAGSFFFPTQIRYG